MIKDLVRELIYKVAPSVVNDAVNQAARADLIEKRLAKLSKRSRRASPSR